jgi:uncharacterized phosphosugar-binding protein
MDVTGRWIDEARRLLDRLEATQMDSMAEASAICASAISSGGLVHLFGSGHSRIPAEEMFPRYGSYPGFHPIAELSMTFHTQIVGSNGQRQAMFIERVEGLAEVILSNYTFGPNDAFVVFSVSGRSAVPVEVAMGAHQRGMRVIAVTSIAESTAVPSRHSSGTRLLDHADVVIDLGTPSGDALVEIGSSGVRVGPGSSFAFVAVANEIKVQTAELLAQRDALPAVITSASVVGEERSNALFDAAYSDHATRLARIIDPGGER